MGASCSMFVATATVLLCGCSVVTVPRDVPSTLVHGADSLDPISDTRLAWAKTCLSGQTPKFWARYFNHSDIAERKERFGANKTNRLGSSFTVAEKEILKRESIRLLPVFAQNVNELDSAAGYRHGMINAKDLMDHVGTPILTRQFAAKGLVVVLNQEDKDPPINTEYWTGWVSGMKAGLAPVMGPNGTLRTLIYGRPRGTHAASLKAALQFAQDYDTKNHLGIWPASPVLASDGLDANGKTPRECGRLPDWNASLGDYGELRVAMRQYVLDARSENAIRVDLNALAPAVEKDFLEFLISFSD